MYTEVIIEGKASRDAERYFVPCGNSNCEIVSVKTSGGSGKGVQLAVFYSDYTGNVVTLCEEQVDDSTSAICQNQNGQNYKINGRGFDIAVMPLNPDFIIEDVRLTVTLEVTLPKIYPN